MIGRLAVVLSVAALVGCGGAPAPAGPTTPTPHVPAPVASTRTGPDPVEAAYAREAETRRVQWVRWALSDFHVEATTAQVDDWIAAHPDEAREAFERARHHFVGLPPQVRARHILVKVETTASPEQHRAARAKIASIQRRLRAGEDFAALARELSEDRGSASRGGDLGWSSRGRMVEPFDTVMFRTPVGRVSAVVQTPFGLSLMRVEGRRQGDVPEAEALREVAVPEAERALAAATAERAASEVLRRRREGLSAAVLDAELRAACPSDPGARGPRVRRSLLFRRGDPDVAIVPIESMDSTALTDAAFAATLEHPFAPEPLALHDSIFVLWLTEIVPAAPEGLTGEVRACLEAGTGGECVPRSDPEFDPARVEFAVPSCQEDP